MSAKFGNDKHERLGSQQNYRPNQSFNPRQQAADLFNDEQEMFCLDLDG